MIRKTIIVVFLTLALGISLAIGFSYRGRIMEEYLLGGYRIELNVERGLAKITTQCETSSARGQDPLQRDESLDTSILDVRFVRDATTQALLDREIVLPILRRLKESGRRTKALGRKGSLGGWLGIRAHDDNFMYTLFTSPRVLRADDHFTYYWFEDVGDHETLVSLLEPWRHPSSAIPETLPVKFGLFRRLQAPRSFQFRLWIPSLALVIYPAISFIRRAERKRRWRIARGLCKNCEYDLTGNESGVCPECGTEIDKPMMTTAKKRCQDELPST